MTKAPSNPRGPNRAAALAQYCRRAGIYDLELALFEPIRRRAIETLAKAQERVTAKRWKNVLLVLPAALRSVTSLEGLDQPWKGLIPYLGPLKLERLWAGGVYVASGQKRMAA
jgi:hypothetical protein